MTIDNNLKEWFNSLPKELQKSAQEAPAPFDPMKTLGDWYNKGTTGVSDWWGNLKPGTREGIKRFGYGAIPGAIGALGYNMFAPAGKEKGWLNMALPLLTGSINTAYPQIQPYLKGLYDNYMKQKELAPKEAPPVVPASEPVA
ncbi:hypothetical protein ACFLQL_00130 [Verrucomicrobiota bacterium]